MKRLVSTIESRIYGLLSLLNGAAVAAVWYSNHQAMQLHQPWAGHDLSLLKVPALASLIIGLGLLFSKLWAQLIFLMGATVLALALIIGSVSAVPFPWILINWSYGAVLLIPAALLISSWKRAHKTASHGY